MIRVRPRSRSARPGQVLADEAVRTPVSSTKPTPETETSRAPVERGSYAAVVLPIAAMILVETFFFVFVGADDAIELAGIALASATFAGKFIVLRGLHADGLFTSPYHLVPLIVFLDMFTATMAVYNMPFLYRIPKLGKRIHAMKGTGERTLKRNPWMRKVTFLAVVAFVTFPLAGTGAIGGSLIGRLLGLSRARTLLGIFVGANVGGLVMAGLADVFGDSLRNFKDNPVSLIGGILVVGGAGYWLYRRAKADTGSSTPEPSADEDTSDARDDG